MTIPLEIYISWLCHLEEDIWYKHDHRWGEATWLSPDGHQDWEITDE